MTEGPVKISDFKNCSEVTLSIESGSDIKYADTRVLQYTFAISPKDSKIPSFVEEVKGNILTKNALGRISSARPGDMVVLANVKIRTKKGIEDAKGAFYKITGE